MIQQDFQLVQISTGQFANITYLPITELVCQAGQAWNDGIGMLLVHRLDGLQAQKALLGKSGHTAFQQFQALKDIEEHAIFPDI
jgi:hypothetical protein